ncbi:MAG: folate-binding protein YgfZ [Candidatus Dormibacteria bacterium]
MSAPGSPFAAAGVVDRSDRAKLRFRGNQALWFCDQLLSNQVVDLADGEGAEALLLTPHGKIRALLRLVSSGGEVMADMEPRLAAELAEFFQGRVFSTRVEIENVTDACGLVSVLGPAAEDTVRTVTLVDRLPAAREHASVRCAAALIVRVARPIPGLDLFVPKGALDVTLASLAAAGGTLAAHEEYETLRATHGLARDRVDIDDGFLPQEAALERAVHFAKGCYLGQEAVAMTQRGRVKRRLRHLRFDGAARAGVIRHEGQEVGRVTSLGDGFGIGPVRTSVALGATVAVGEDPPTAAVVEELPGTVAGPRVPSARELRERLAGVPGSGGREPTP